MSALVLMRSKARDAVLLALSLMLLLETARATNFSWTSSSGQFNTAANWTQSGAPADLDGIPDANDIVMFNRGNVALYPVFFGNILVPNSDIHPTVDKVIIGNNPLSFAGLHGSTLTVDSTNITETARGVVIGSGAGDVAALTSTLATFATQYATFGSAAGSSGTLNLTSASAGEFSVSGIGATYDLIVGLNGSGTINVTNGRDVTVADDAVLGQNATGVGNVSVSGAGSTWTNSGDFVLAGSGTGTLNVDAGGALSSANGYLGNNASSTGTATISGAGTTWSNTGALYVGHSGNATLNLTTGGDVISPTIYLGYNSSSIGVANVSTVGGGNLTRLALSGELFVGHNGAGNLNIMEGGYVQSTNGYVGHNTLSEGSVTVASADSQWNNTGNLFVGNAGNGTLAIRGGGQINNATGYIGNEVGSTGTVTVDGVGSTWTGGILRIGNEGNGTLNITNGGLVSYDGGSIGTLSGSIGKVTVSGASGGSRSTLTTSSSLSIGGSGSGSLEVLAGSMVTSSSGTITGMLGSTGRATVDGGDSVWANSTDLTVGNAGTLVINNGGMVSTATMLIAGSDASPPLVRVSGSNTMLTSQEILRVGSFRDPTLGSLVIEDGAAVSNSWGLVGQSVGSNGSVVVDGDGSAWNNSAGLLVGYEGEAQLEIIGGGRVNALSAKVGPQGRLHVGKGSTISIEGNGYGAWDTPFEAIQVGGTGSFPIDLTLQSTASIDLGADTFTFYGQIYTGNDALFASRTGLLTFGSPYYSLLNTNLSSIPLEAAIAPMWDEWDNGSGAFYAGKFEDLDGDGANDRLIIEWENLPHIGTSGADRGTFQAILYLNTGPSNGAITFNYVDLIVEDPQSAPTNDNGGTATIGIKNSNDQGSSPLLVSFNGSNSVESNQAHQITYESLTNDGLIEGSGTIAAQIVLNLGTISPGDSAGALLLDSSFSQSNDGDLQIELASNANYDQLLVTGDATLAGTLTVNLIDGFTPSIGQMFTILTADTVHGEFDNPPLPNASNFGFDVIYNAQSVVLTVVSTLPGDYNGDGAVDAADYVVWRKTDGTQEGYDTWRANFGTTVGSGAAAADSANAAVPEPTSRLIVILGMLAIFSRRRVVVS